MQLTRTGTDVPESEIMAKQSKPDNTVSPRVVAVVIAVVVLLVGGTAWWLFVRDRSGADNLTVEQKAEQIRKAREPGSQPRHTL